MRKYEYNDNYNPYYRLPDFVGLVFFSKWVNFFHKNNLVKTRTFVNGVEQTNYSELTFEYLDNGLPQIIRTQFGQGDLHIKTFKYECI